MILLTKHTITDKKCVSVRVSVIGKVSDIIDDTALTDNSTLKGTFCQSVPLGHD